MKPIKIRLCLWLGIWSGVLFAAQCHAKEFSTSQIASMVRPIESLAIQYGAGDIKAYVFVDPKCPHSRDFLSMIHDNKKMQGIYHYYIFFYELKRFHSHALIGTIYASSSPLQQTLEVMVGGKEIEEVKAVPQKIDEQIGVIERVAEAIGVNKRPYLIIKKELD